MVVLVARWAGKRRRKRLAAAVRKARKAGCQEKAKVLVLRERVRRLEAEQQLLEKLRGEK
jgi:hypothetical protein